MSQNQPSNPIVTFHGIHDPRPVKVERRSQSFSVTEWQVNGLRQTHCFQLVHDPAPKGQVALALGFARHLDVCARRSFPSPASTKIVMFFLLAACSPSFEQKALEVLHMNFKFKREMTVRIRTEDSTDVSPGKGGTFFFQWPFALARSSIQVSRPSLWTTRFHPVARSVGPFVPSSCAGASWTHFRVSPFAFMSVAGRRVFDICSSACFSGASMIRVALQASICLLSKATKISHATADREAGNTSKLSVI